MRYVNRRRLFVVVVLAALFGAVLPYIEWAAEWALPDSWAAKPEAAAENPIYNDFYLKPPGVRTAQTSFLFSDHTIVYGFGGSAQDWQSVRKLTGNLVPESLSDKVRRGIILQRIGWPFRATYMYSECGGRSDLGLNSFAVTPTTLWKLNWVPRLWPTKLLWPGMIGNILAVILCSSATYIGIGWLRTTLRHKAGRCRKCKYDVRDLTVCPECGTVT